jgi:hypothetical protein
MYCSYSSIANLWQNQGLILVCLFFALALPFISRISNKIEERCFFFTCSVSLGRVGRFLFQFCINYAVFITFLHYQVVNPTNVQSFGGIAGVAFLTTATSQGMQYVAILLSNRGIGNVNMNVIFSLAFVTFITALAVLGMGWIKDIFSYLGIFFLLILFSVGLLSDIRALCAPKNGIGIVLGILNPFSSDHLAIIERALQKRDLEKIFIHVATMLPMQVKALKKEEIKIKTQSNNSITCETTAKADVHVDYFPTGNEFIEYGAKISLISDIINASKLREKIEIISYPAIYDKEGFYGVIKEIKHINPLKKIHGLHGNDFDGLVIRKIYDEAGWIFPYTAFWATSGNFKG